MVFLGYPWRRQSHQMVRCGLWLGYSGFSKYLGHSGDWCRRSEDWLDSHNWSLWYEAQSDLWGGANFVLFKHGGVSWAGLVQKLELDEKLIVREPKHTDSRISRSMPSNHRTRGSSSSGAPACPSPLPSQELIGAEGRELGIESFRSTVCWPFTVLYSFLRRSHIWVSSTPTWKPAVGDALFSSRRPSRCLLTSVAVIRLRSIFNESGRILGSQKRSRKTEKKQETGKSVVTFCFLRMKCRDDPTSSLGAVRFVLAGAPESSLLYLVWWFVGREGIVRCVCMCACAHARVPEPEPLRIKPHSVRGELSWSHFFGHWGQELETVWAIQAELFHLV